MAGKTKKYNKIPLEVSIHLCYLHQDGGLSLKQLQQRYPQFSKTSVHTHSKLPVNKANKDGRHSNKGRPHKLSERDNRKLVSSLLKLRETIGDIHSTDIQKDSGIGSQVSNRTVRRVLKKHGYNFSQCRKKGLLLKEDLKKRLVFAHKCKRLSPTLWTEGISFYLDGTGWVHKTDPTQNKRTARTRTWRKKGEGLERHCTAKGKKEGVCGKMAKFMVAIAHNKGVITCEQYTGAINAETCKQFIEDNFAEMFENSANPRGKLFLQDGDPSQNSKLAEETWVSKGCRLFKIAPRSPDLNPIENIFHLIGKQMKQDALDQHLERETYQAFCHRVKKTVLQFPTSVIDETIESMPRRIDEVIRRKGGRTKY